MPRQSGVPRTVEQARIDAEAAEMRSRSMSYQSIADIQGCSKSIAWERVHRALADIARDPAEAVIRLEMEKLDRIERAALAVMETPEGKAADVLAAVNQLRAVSESRRKLLGLDAASKVDVNAAVKYEYEGVNTDDV